MFAIDGSFLHIHVYSTSYTSKLIYVDDISFLDFFGVLCSYSYTILLLMDRISLANDILLLLKDYVSLYGE